jgi:hypothetical protein
MAAFNEVGGKNYLRAVAKSEPRTFCTKLGKSCRRRCSGAAG